MEVKWILWKSSYSHMNSRTHELTHAHTYTNTYTKIHTHTNTNARARAQTHAEGCRRCVFFWQRLQRSSYMLYRVGHEGLNDFKGSKVRHGFVVLHVTALQSETWYCHSKCQSVTKRDMILSFSMLSLKSNIRCFNYKCYSVTKRDIVLSF